MPDSPPVAPSSWYRALDRHTPRLDGLRGIAILLVLFYHLCHYGLAKTPVARVFTTLVVMGWSGVDLFFVLSGFLITSILLRQRDSSSYFRTFYARRVIRIFPLYYAVLVLFLWVLPAITTQAEGFWMAGADRETVWYWLFLSNLQAAFTGNYQHYFLEITWSLAIEEQFYLVWPLLVYVTSRRQLIWICSGILVGALAMRLAIAWYGTPNPIFLYTFTPCRLDELAAGALIAALAVDEANIPRLARWSRPALWGGILAYVVAQLCLATRMQTIAFTLLAAIFGGLLVRAMIAPRGALLPRILESAVLRSFGKYSFGLYLLHMLGGEIARVFFDPELYKGSFFVAQFVYWAAAIGCTYLLALGSWYGLEVHAHRLRRFFPYRAVTTGSARLAPARQPD
ncbi:MAG TPA: acyltransferase [Myxococcota bacterium]|nr:acyltransferase [Myxococcota bacterium]